MEKIGLICQCGVVTKFDGKEEGDALLKAHQSGWRDGVCPMCIWRIQARRHINEQKKIIARY